MQPVQSAGKSTLAMLQVSPDWIRNQHAFPDWFSTLHESPELITLSSVNMGHRPNSQPTATRSFRRNICTGSLKPSEMQV